MSLRTLKQCRRLLCGSTEGIAQRVVLYARRLIIFALLLALAMMPLRTLYCYRRVSTRLVARCIDYAVRIV